MTDSCELGSARLIMSGASGNFGRPANQHNLLMHPQKSLLFGENRHVVWQVPRC